MDIFAPANFSDDRRHRYSLRRIIGGELNFFNSYVVLLCGYNPSTANERDNDPTIRKECKFAEYLAATNMIKVNLFAGVATDPNDLSAFDDPIGSENDSVLRAAIAEADLCVAAWGAPKGCKETKVQFLEREAYVHGLASWMCYGTTKDGHPRHPLYLPYRTPLERWPPISSE